MVTYPIFTAELCRVPPKWEIITSAVVRGVTPLALAMGGFALAFGPWGIIGSRTMKQILDPYAITAAVATPVLLGTLVMAIALRDELAEKSIAAEIKALPVATREALVRARQDLQLNGFTIR